MSEPLITDWINSIAALLGVPIVVWGVIKLFLKDQAQERKLNSLEKLAVSQDEMNIKMTEQIQELAKQTAEYQFQSELMQESNSLIIKQIELQNDIFLHNKGIEEKKLEIQNIKRVNEIKPYFVTHGGYGSSSNFSFSIKNKGNTARNLSIKKLNGDNIHFEKLNSEIEIDTGNSIEIKASISTQGRYSDNGSREYEIELYYEDIDGNKYRSDILNGKISKPVLIG